MTPTWRWLLLGGAALLLGAIGALVGWPPQFRVQPLAPPSLALPQASQAAPAELRWREGSAQHYRVETDSSLRISTSGTATAQALGVRMQARLELRTLQAGAEVALVGMRFSAVKLEVAGKSDPQTDAALATPFRVRFVSGGLPESFEFPAAVTARHREMLEAVVRMFQVTMRAAPAWVAQEANATGSYEASYARSGPSGVAKSKRRFVGAPSSPTFAGAEITSNDSFTIETGRDWIASMTVDETLRGSGHGGPAVAITNRATLELLPTEAVAEAPALWNFAAAAPAPESQAPLPMANLSQRQAQSLLRTEVAALDAAREGRSVRIHRLRDLLRAQEAMPAVLLDAMKTQQLSDRTRADLYLAFELAGTAPAQAALTSVLTDADWSSRDALRAAVALGGVARPSADAVAALWRAAQGKATEGDKGQLASTAIFALGSVGKAMATNQDAGYGELRARLLSGALQGSDLGARANFTHAVGNTRDPSLAPEIVGLLNDGSAEVRRAAAQSLGMLGSDAVADQLLARLAQERSAQVRAALAESLVSWSTPTAAAMSSMRTAITTERDEETRLQMGLLLAKASKTLPENERALQGLLRSEPSQRVRQGVAEAMATAK